ncbi:hypothetical protein C4577_02760 [Candidatus Parcubacteria bacterium]|nr:MAG: hypothetical protein C4577_02760 [Candidatus Parcubacteria bacterium]
MPKRSIPLINEEYYHIFNRGVNKQPIFLDKREYRRALDLIEFYSYSGKKISYSRFLSMSLENKEEYMKLLFQNNKKLINIVCFALMPNHFHFLLKQLEDNGISNFMSNFQNSYSRYFNIKNNRIGHLLQGQFKSVHIEDDSQLLHLSRYIHLNPYSSCIVRSIEEVESYPYSSYHEYLNIKGSKICSKEIILSQFRNLKDYQKFVSDRASYQKELEKIKHLILEDRY